MTDSSPDGAGPDAGHARAAAVKAQLLDRLADDARLRGVGLARDGDAGSFRVEVRVADEQHIAELALPSVLDGVPVRVCAIGDVAAGGRGRVCTCSRCCRRWAS